MVEICYIQRGWFSLLREITAVPVADCRNWRKKGEFIYLKRGLYEDDLSVPGQALASAIYGPSYRSFDYALHHRGLIPETVFEYTSATCGKNRTKMFRNSFGRYSYRDVPAEVFSEGIVKLDDGYYATWIATPEKALYDKLYSIRTDFRL